MVFKGITWKNFHCWQCQKERMLRPLDWAPTNEEVCIKIPNGEIKFLKDTCHICTQKNLASLEKKRGTAEASLVLKAMQDTVMGNPTQLDKSLEELL